jgi:carbon-monoxide dehydrogenase large subunit
MGQFGIGQSVTRFEDPRLLRGGGRFINDVNLPGQAHAVVVRSMHAHAKIRSIDSAAARQAPGVLAVFTGADVARDGLGTMRMTLTRKRPDGSPMFASPHRGLSQDRGRYVGDPIALVVAETLAEAEDAADLVRVDYEPLPAVTSTAEAIGGAPVWDECPDNISNIFEAGDRAAADAALAGAHRIVRRRYVISRVHAQYMEPRGTLGVYDSAEDRYTLYADVQYPHRVRNALATNIFKVPEHQIRVIAGDVGGASAPRAGNTPSTGSSCGRRAAPADREVVVRPARRHPADEHARDNVTGVNWA